jgi:hypothetical protein
MGFLKKVFSSIGGAFKKLFNATPTVLQRVSSIISLTAPLGKLILAQVDPKDAPEVGNVIAEVQATMSTVATVVSHAHGAPDANTLAHISTGLGAIVGDIGGLLAAGHIKNPTIKADVEAGLEELQAVIGQLGTVSPAPAA